MATKKKTKTDHQFYKAPCPSIDQILRIKRLDTASAIKLFNELKEFVAGLKQENAITAYANKLIQELLNDPDVLKPYLDDDLAYGLVLKEVYDCIVDIYMPFRIEYVCSDMNNRLKSPNPNTPATPDEILDALEGFMPSSTTKTKKDVQPKTLKDLQSLEATLKKGVIGQDQAIETLIKKSKLISVGFEKRGAFFFIGRTGVGKTELAKVLAKYMFDSEDALIRVDMSEYMEKFAVSRLVGAPPGYVGYEEGGQLTEKVRRKPYSIVLLDEIEKAHPDVFNILLQVFDDGILTDGLGRKIDFKNTVIIMTSNVGVRDIKAGGSIGFSDKSPDGQYDQMKSTIEESMRRMFNPEFLNRIDDYIVFKQLKKEHIHAIIDIQLEKLLKRMQSMNIELVLSPEAKDFLVDKGYDEKYGARPLRRALQKYLEDPLAEELLKSVVKEDTLVEVDFSTQLQELTFSVLPKPKLALPAHETIEGVDDPSPEEDPMSAE